MNEFIIKPDPPEFIFFLQHPEKKDHYLIIQEAEITMKKFLQQFNRTGKYENEIDLIMPHNNVTLIEKIAVPDKSLFGLCYFICNELEEITYKEDERWPYKEWGWYIITGPLQTSKWLQEYITITEQKKNIKKEKQINEIPQISFDFRTT